MFKYNFVRVSYNTKFNEFKSQHKVQTHHCLTLFTECSIIGENFRILGLNIVLNSSILTFEWEISPACFISAVISNNNFSQDIDNGIPLELESPNEHHNINLIFRCNNDLLARINITEVMETTRFMNINIPKMHLAEGKNIHVISAQQNSDTQYYYEWIWSTESSGNLQTCTND